MVHLSLVYYYELTDRLCLDLTSFSLMSFFCVFQDLIQETTLHSVVMSSQPPPFMTVSQPFFVFITLIAWKSTNWAFWKISLTFFSWSDWSYGFLWRTLQTWSVLLALYVRGYLVSMWVIPGEVNLGHLTEVVFARFPTVKSLFPPFSNIFFKRESLSPKSSPQMKDASLMFSLFRNM